MTRAGYPDNETCFIKMFDDVQLEFGFKSISDQHNLIKNADGLCDPLVEINTNNPIFYLYGIVELNNETTLEHQEKNLIQYDGILETPFVQLGHMKTVFTERLGEYITVVSS